MKIDVNAWHEFRIDTLFKLENGKNHSAADLTPGGDALYIGAKKSDNGVMAHVVDDPTVTSQGNCMVFVCNGDGSVGYANYMDRDFIGTGDIVAGYNDNLTPLSGLFIATVFGLERPRYSWGRKLKKTLPSTVIRLPSNSDGEPDWQWMEEYMKTFHAKPLTTQNKGNDVAAFDYTEWGEFKVGSLFDILNGRGVTTDEISDHPGDFPAVQSGEEDRGILGYIDLGYARNQGYTFTSDRCLTVARSGTAGCIHYFDKGCVVGDSAKILRLKKPQSKYVYLFLATILSALRYKYSYGRKVTEEKYAQEIIRLPQTSNHIPDWEWMENYMKSLPYADRI